MLSVGSVCSGAGGFDLGFRNAGYRTAWLCEFDPWRQQLLAKNFPGVKCWPDLSTLDPAQLERPDVLIGGTPCQDLSVAGQRAGLDGERSGLFWDYMRVRNELGIEWCIWENVAGALSSNAGLDFASVLGAMVGADVHVPGGGWPGAGVAAGPWGGCVWRLLDAQHFGVPQRRRRVFVVGHLGGPCPPEVLLEPTGGRGDLEARGGSSSRVAAPLTRGSSSPGVSEPGRRKEDDYNVVSALDTQRGGPDDNSAQAGHLIAGALTRRVGKGVDSDGLGMPLVAHTLRATGFDASEDGTGRGTPLVTDRVREADELAARVDGAVAMNLRGRDGGAHAEFSDVASLRAADGGSSRSYVATSIKDVSHAGKEYDPRNGGLGIGDDQAFALDRRGNAGVGTTPLPSGIASAYDPQPDGRRYAACGDGVVSNVAEWIARRLTEVIELVPENREDAADAA